MFIGHWAPAFAAAAISPKAPKLGTLFVAGQLVDWGFAILAMGGVEKLRVVPGITAMNSMDLYHMPYTHSLLGTAIWAAAFALIVFVWQKNFTGALIAGAVVLSHWFVDLLVHRPDLTITGAPPPVGLGLWNYPLIAIPLELAITIAAFAWYVRRTRGPIVPPMILLGLLLVLQFSNWFGPQPSSIGPAVLLAGMATFGVVTFFAYWVGTTRRHKRLRG
ncbi:hypothetical protein [Allopontixanthobacter sediminis]|uniref:Uncharacterized protein n=1 Tax=Allopontixanthobacter sediminis TaxID=1689985 RepID=A0A845B279_9SPHN|nr:hypothetical protein [Allopontixanthobacter sediminis]MXP43732.1 hypothetical protein [Allopontixanthobacter sediminis]